MSDKIPSATFRIEHGFTATPDLTCDDGPGRSVLIGQNSPGDELEAIYIGKQAEPPFRDVWMDTRGAHVVYVMGKRRSGKSYTLGVLGEGLAASSWVKQGELSQGILILDTMNVYLTMMAGVADTFSDDAAPVRELRKWKLPTERLPLVAFHPRGTTLPPGVPSVQLGLRASDLGVEEWCGLFGADPFADPLGHLISELHEKVSTDGYVDLRSTRRIPPKPDFTIPDLLTALEGDVDIQRYHRDTIESLRRRLNAVRRLPVFSDQGLDVRTVVRPGRVSILFLRELGFHLRAVLVGLIVKKVMELRGMAEQQERMIPVHEARADKLSDSDPGQAGRERELARTCRDRAGEGVPRCWLIIDEAHNYIPTTGAVASRAPLKKYVSEGRNLGLSIVVATQHPAGLDPSIRRNADMLLIHALSHRDDINTAEGMINTSPPLDVTVDGRTKGEGSHVFEMIVRNLPLGYALAATDRANRLFPIRIRPRITVHGGSDY